MNKIEFSNLEEVKDPRILAELLFDFYDEFPCTLLTALSADCIKEALEQAPEANKVRLLLVPAVVHSFGVEVIATIIDFSHFFRSLLEANKDREEFLEKPVIDTNDRLQS
jgi:hypothetical protein